MLEKGLSAIRYPISRKRTLVMFGVNLPHGFTTDMYCSQVIIQMTYDFMGQVLLINLNCVPLKCCLSEPSEV